LLVLPPNLMFWQKEKGEVLMRRGLLLVLVTAVMLAAIAGVAQAIINGAPDRGPKAHPYVGALVTEFEVAKGKTELLPACSGTLISPRVFLTAGHCTDFLIEEDLPTYVSFDPTYKPGTSELTKGTPYLHPTFCVPTPDNKAGCAPPGRPELVGTLPRDFRYDVGVVVLKEPVRMATYGALPDAGLVDTLKEGQRLTTVGYGANRFAIDREPPLPPEPVYLDDRYRATVRLLDTKPAVGDQFVKTTGVSLRGDKGESSCYGDSGGPLFMPDQQTIVGVTSFGIAPLCRGPGYYQRVDLPRVIKWVRSFP
jgi:Trypsin